MDPGGAARSHRPLPAPRGGGSRLIVFSLEDVIDGVFNLYVAEGWDTLGWAAIFVASLAVVAYWGASDEEGLEAVSERVEEIQEAEGP
jgi:hypothetical protein